MLPEQRAALIKDIFSEWTKEDKAVIKKYLDDLEFYNNGLYVIIKVGREYNRFQTSFDDKGFDNLIESLNKFKEDNKGMFNQKVNGNSGKKKSDTEDN